MIQKSILPGICIAFLVLASCSENKMKPKQVKLPAAFKRIQDKSIEDSTLVKLVKNLDTSFHEPREFWQNMIDDTTYSDFHRRMCAVKFVERFAKPGTQLSDFPDISTLIDTGLMYGFVYELDTNMLRRKVIRGGSWKDVGYYLSTSTRSYDSLYTKFTQTMREKGYKVFCVNLVQHDYMCTRCVLPRYSAAFQLALEGEITDEGLKDFLTNRHLPKGKKIIVRGVYTVIANDDKHDDL